MQDEKGTVPIMDLKHEKMGEITLIQVSGSIKMGDSAYRFSEYLEKVLQVDSIKKVLLDMSEINYMDSMGLGELIGHLQRFRDQGGRIGLVKPTKRVFTLLQLSGLDEVFPIFEDRQAALAAWG
ncbi:MAG: STAS domain-containing protein [Acidobacteria bacterium]|nr:STAS domain-containing protein [Acidobacteriota bacterium]MCB9399729.1 STAS domain-containing protein [Acidobacteriota bacterium]